MNVAGISDSVRIPSDVAACAKCGSTSRVGRGFCLNCLLHRGLETDTDSTETLDEVLAEVDVRDTEWRLGNYQILEEIGRGGMGVIYRARQRHSRRIVAVKRVLSYHADSRETLARFRREAQAAASLDHPNILPIYEVSESEDGLPFFSMKFAPGGTLQQMAPALRNEPRQCVALVAKIARAVQHAHSKGVLHRDLKPGNILLDGRGEPLVSDFGLAKWLDTTSDLTRTLTIFGTPGYIAPEQATHSAAELKPTADIYSLGAILFDLLAGRPPFLGNHALSVIRQASESPAPKLRTFSKLADRDLETICSRCLERERGARYPSAHNLAEDLERWLEGRPIIARRTLPPTRIWRWAKRTPKLAATLAACLSLAVVAGVWQFQNHRLSSTVREEQLASHSVAVLPFLDLDTVQADTLITANVADVLQKGMSRFGPARIHPVTQPHSKWTGTGIQDEVRFITAQTKAAAVLAGTVRKTPRGKRLSLRLVKSNESEVLKTWLIELDDRGIFPDSLARHNFAQQIYQVLNEGGKNSLQPAAIDPAMKDDVARGYLNAGRGLMDRRTIADLDRAISCFESALRTAPRSVLTRSYLAMACLGRNYLSSHQQSRERAKQVAREAIALAPQDATANRALFFVAESEGRYVEALEYGLRSIELGDPSERAFGQIAYAWRMLGHPDTAILWYQKAKISEQQPADYDALLGDCYTDLGLDNEARAAYESAANFRPDLPEGWAGLCRLELLTGNVEKARQICRNKLSAYSGSSVARQTEAFVEFLARNYAKAESLYSDLLAEEPGGGEKAGSYGSVNYLSALARIKVEHGDIEAARGLADKCSRAISANQTQDSETLYTLAGTEAVNGRSETSLTFLRSAINNGWMDHRLMSLDPRFDNVRTMPAFEKLLNDLTTKVSDLRRQWPPVQLASKEQ